MNKTILISGVNGFIGSNLVNVLKDRYTIIGLDIYVAERNLDFKTYLWEEIGQLPEIDVIIHLAGIAHDTSFGIKEEEYFNINVGLTKTLFQFYIQSNAEVFIFLSSVKAVADTVEEEILSEESVPKPLTPYGKSKLEAENFILSQSLPIYKKVYILRPCMIHGPNNKGNLNLLYKIILKGYPWPLGAFVNQRSFCSIDNILFVIQELILRNIESGTYLVADDEGLSTNDIVHLIACSMNRKAYILKVSQKAIHLMAKIGDILGLSLNSENLKKLTENYFVSNEKLKVALGIRSMPVTAVEGFRKTFESFLLNDSKS